MADNPVQQILQTAAGYIASSPLYVVARLKVADQLAHGPKSAAELADATGANADALSSSWGPPLVIEAVRRRAGRT